MTSLEFEANTHIPCLEGGLLMHGLPAGFNPSFFEGESLIQVCVGLLEVILRFGHEIDLTIECDVHNNISGSRLTFTDRKKAGAALLELLQEEVVKARSSEDGTLVLEFASGEFELRDASDPYESHQVRRGRDVYIV